MIINVTDPSLEEKVIINVMIINVTDLSLEEKVIINVIRFT